MNFEFATSARILFGTGSLSASSMKGNPVALTDNDIMAILKNAL